MDSSSPNSTSISPALNSAERTSRILTGGPRVDIATPTQKCQHCDGSVDAVARCTACNDEAMFYCAGCRRRHEEECNANLPGTTNVENPSRHFLVALLEITPHINRRDAAKRLDQMNDAKIVLSHGADDAQTMPPPLVDCVSSSGPSSAVSSGPQQCSCWAPGKPLQVLYVTWNLAKKIPVGTRSLLYPYAHIICVATQENGGYVCGGSAQDQWEQEIASKCLSDQFTVIATHRMMAIHCIVFARTRDVAHYIAHVHISQVKTGALGGALGNKGGVAIALTVASSVCSTTAQKPKWCEQFTAIQSRESAHCKSTSMATKRRDQVSMCFIASHLTAHQEFAGKRNEDYLRIVSEMKIGRKGPYPQCTRQQPRRRGQKMTQTKTTSSLPDAAAAESAPRPGTSPTEPTLTAHQFNTLIHPQPLPQQQNATTPTPINVDDVTKDFDVCFFGGDLNYRINGTKAMIEHIIANMTELRAVLVHNDQLSIEQKKGIVFHGFSEGALSFAPTFKLDIKSQGTRYQQGKDARIPSYTDRILYRKHESFPGEVKLLSYMAFRDSTSSDHRPVIALFSVTTPNPAARDDERSSTTENGWSDAEDEDGGVAGDYLAPSSTPGCCC